MLIITKSWNHMYQSCWLLRGLPGMWEKKWLYASERADSRNPRLGCPRWSEHCIHFTDTSSQKRLGHLLHLEYLPSLRVIFFFFLWEFMSKSSVTEHEMRKEDGKCLNPATLPISCLWECPHTDLGRLGWDARAATEYPFYADLAWPSVSEHPRIHPSVYFLVASQMRRWWMLDVDCFLCENPKEIKLFREEENASLSLWSGHNCIHTVGPLRQMLEHTYYY